MYIRPGGSGRAGRARARPKVQPERKRSGRLSTSPTKNSGPTGSGGPRPYQKLAQALPKVQPRRKRSGRLGSARPKIQARPKFMPGPDQMKSASAGPVYTSALRLLGRFTTCLAQTTTALRLLFASTWHFVPHKC